MPVEAVRLRLGYIEALTWRGWVYVAWSDVADASWERNYLVIRYGGKKSVFIPYVVGAEESEKMILGLIRQLRTASTPTAVSIPDTLRTGPMELANIIDPSGQEAGPVELKQTHPERVAAGVLAALVLGLIPLFVYERTDSAGLALAIVAASWLIGFLMASTYRYQANDEGVTKRLLWWKRTMRWTDVADFEFRKSSGRSKTPKWVLRDADGAKLIDITLDLGPKSDKLAVESLVWTNLALTLPAEKLQRPWLARSGIPTSDRGQLEDSRATQETSRPGQSERLV